MNKSQFINKLKNTNNLFANKTLLDEVNENEIDINKLHNEFVIFRSSLKVMSSTDYGTEYGRLEFAEDIEEFTIYCYNGCFIEYNEEPTKFHVPLYNSGFEGTLTDCEIHLFIEFYMYECIGLDKLTNKEKE
mgnify:CR=1 FL=1